ncbi:gamma-glutamyl-gamma-aminobutyraldehyde dehydrogenase [Nonomuraea thailandensis]|uniref:Gamma-glutamyl-gamma-aminobutyraldehyde dehydrogenase n=1 Tax=Nonomuraea thailandensis TaxID=1188745 RepID=A0A9X2GID5_9ACTN|nr:aldehyde dehydrogenase family protein [Nonomuraea thailandensis]MCP2358265.1 gamma-glutamyl-gamma-aminobutyraldehyde dehydrogenase [Nonomuraea thailandensis]
MTERTHEDWLALARKVVPATTAWIGGPVPSLSGATRTTVNPATGAVLAEVAECDEHDVDAAVAAARRAFEGGAWSTASPRDRAAVLHRIARKIEDHVEELALLDSLDAGKRIADTIAIDAPGSAAILRWYAESLDKVYGEVAPTGAADLAVVTREPLGVVAAVVPWNYPLEMAIWKIAPALAAGNSVILKPAEDSPLSALRLAGLAAEAGLPDGVLSVVPGAGPVAGRALGRHRGVDVVTFTGSTSTGQLFQQYAGQSNLKQVWLEAGGKSAVVVLDDVADLDAAADGVAAGIFTNTGQVCSATSRLVVQRGVADELVQRVVGRALAIDVGDPLDPATGMGPVASERQAARVLELMEAGAAQAREVHGGGLVPDMPAPTYVRPQVLLGVDPDAPIAQTEVFGPVLSVHVVDTVDEAVAVANGTPYALAAGLWTDSLSRAHGVARRLRAGTVSVNCVDALDVATPFGGFGQSGYGRDLSLHALDKFTGLKTTWIHHG